MKRIDRLLALGTMRWAASFVPNGVKRTRVDISLIRFGGLMLARFDA